MDGLTSRQREALQLTAYGLTHSEVAHSMGIGTETLKEHLRRARVKMGAENITQAVAAALAARLIEYRPVR